MADDICLLCDEPISTAKLWWDGPAESFTAHRVCMLRAVTGGIGHQRNHEYWCLTMHDTDAGMTLHESALAVDEWIATGKAIRVVD